MFLNRKSLFTFILLIAVSMPIHSKDLISKVIWDSPLEKSRFGSLIKVKKGSGYSVRDVRRTVKLLYATKLFEQIVVTESFDSTGDAELAIKGVPQLFIKDISIKGNSKMSNKDVKLAADIGLNMPLFSSKLEKIREEIIFLYREEGFFDTLVNVATDITGDDSVKIKINITEGPQEKIKKIVLSGSMFKSVRRRLEFDLAASFRGKPFTDRNIDDMNEYLINYFRERDYLDVSTKIGKGENGKVIFTVNQGPHYILDIPETGSFSVDTIKKVIVSVSNYYFDKEGVERKLLRFFQAYGYHDAVIKVSASTRNPMKSNESRTLKVDIMQKERRFINDIIFTGASVSNRSLVVSRLKDFIEKKIEEEDFPEIKINRNDTGGGYKDTDNERVRTISKSPKDKVMLPDSPLAIPEDYLGEIGEIVKKVYQNEGYINAEVVSSEIIDDSGKLFLHVGVKEKEKFMLSKVTVETGDGALDRMIKGKLILTNEIPYSDRVVNVYRERIVSYLAKKGYLFAWVTEEERFSGNKVDLHFKAEYLFPVKVTEVVIAGNHITKQGVIKSVLRIESGDTLNGESFAYSRRNLLQTGVFDSVSISFIDPEFPAAEKDVTVVVGEIERWKLVPGVGISTDEGPRVTGLIEWKNYLGSGFSTKLSFQLSRKLEIFMGDKFRKYYGRDFSLGEQIERKINLAFIFPDLYLPSVPLSSQIEVFHIHDIRSNAYLPYMIDKYGLFFSLFRRFNNNFFLSTGLELAYQMERDHEEDAEGKVTYSDIDSLQVSPEFRGYIDFRDSLFFPIKGYKTSFKVFNKSTIYGEGSKFTQFENNFAFYVPLQYRLNFAGDLEPRDTIIFHSFIETAFLILHEGELTSDDVLKLGGSTTIRGFFNNEMIPVDHTTGSLQGKYYFFVRNELRFKLFESMYLISFLDFGNLWEKISNLTENDLFRYTTGGGFTYLTPIGAVTAQVGFNLRPQKYEEEWADGIWAFHIFISTF